MNFHRFAMRPKHVDLGRFSYLKYHDGTIGSFDKYVFHEETVSDLTVFKIRQNAICPFCTERFVDRVHQHGLQSFVLVKVWPLPEGVDYMDESKKAHRKAQKIRPQEGPALG